MKKITLKYFAILCGLILMQPVVFGQSDLQSLMGRAPESLHDAYLASNPQPQTFSSLAAGDVQALDLFNGGIYGNFPLVGPYDINQVAILAESVFAADFDNNDVLYALDFATNTLITIDIVDGTTAVVGPLDGLNGGHTVTGLAWNSADSSMYALSTDGASTTLYSIDLGTGTMTIIGDTGNTLGIWIAIDNAGLCYMADIGDDQLYSIDLVSGVATAIGPLGIDISFAQDVDVDPATNELYMAGYLASGDSNVYTVDVTTGATTLQGTTNGSELGIFAIEGQAELNDDPETAANLTVGLVFEDFPAIADNTEATATAIDDPSCGNFTEADLWYSFTVPDSGSVSVESREDDGSITDTALSIYEGEIGALVEVVCNDDGGVGLFSLAEVEGRTPGEVLYARVWEWNGGSLGTFQMSAYDTPPPANDDPEGAIPLMVGAVFTDFPVTASNVSATDTAIDDPSCGNYGGADVWFTVTVPSTGQVSIEVDTAGGITDTGMSVYSGEIGALVEVSCNDDGGNGLFSLVAIDDPTLAGMTLFVRVWEWGGGGFGDFQIAAYSDCAVNAAEIETSTGATEVSICVGDDMPDPIDVTMVGDPIGTNSGWVITDNVTGEILGLPMAPPFDLDGVEPGVCAIWYIRYEDGLTGLDMGANVADLDGCFDLSNPILVDRVNEGGVCEMCEYTLEMNDSFGDGWNGATMNVLVDGVVVLDGVSLDDDPNNDEFQGFLSFPVNSTADVTTVFIDGGGFPGEVSYRILDVVGNEVGSGTADPTTDIVSGTIEADCPSCLQPVDLTVTNITDDSAELSWTDLNDPVSPEYTLEWGLEGFTPGDGTLETGITTTTFLLEGLDPETSYDFYVTTNCEVDDSSETSGPVTFLTMPTCPSPFDLAAGNFAPGSVDLSWSMPINALGYSWEIQDVGVPQGDPAAIATGNTLIDTFDTATGAFVDGNNYTFYIQAGCTADDFSIYVSIDFLYFLPPANDDCENAIEVVCGDTVTGATTNAGDSGANAAGDVFYTYVTPETAQNVTLSLCDGATDFDSLLRVFDDECNLVNEIAVNDDTCGLQSELTFTATVGNSYTIMVEGFGGNVGNFSMAVTCEEALSTDDNTLDGFSFYPNPAQDVITLDARTAIENVTIFNMLGQEVLKQKVDGLSNYQLNVSTMAKGAYLMQVTTNGKVGVYRVMKR